MSKLICDAREHRYQNRGPGGGMSPGMGGGMGAGGMGGYQMLDDWTAPPFFVFMKQLLGCKFDTCTNGNEQNVHGNSAQKLFYFGKLQIFLAEPWQLRLADMQSDVNQANAEVRRVCFLQNEDRCGKSWGALLCCQLPGRETQRPTGSAGLYLKAQV